MQNNYIQPMPQIQMPQIPPIPTTVMLGLNQIEGFQPVQQFVDEMNTHWTLVKAANNSTLDVPDPKAMQVLDYWSTDFPGIKTKLYVYVVEGIRPPRVETEQATRVMYQWFSTKFVKEFTPQMITEREWLRANVYAAPVVNARMSKLNAICHVTGQPQVAQAQEDALITVEELNGHTGGSTETARE